MMWVTGANGATQFINRTYREILGIAGNKGGPTSGSRWSIRTMRRYISGAFERAVRDQPPFRAEVRVRRADGQWRWLGSYATPRLSHSGDYLGHVGLSSDITARRLADETLRESEERFRIMADGCPAAMWVTRCRGGYQIYQPGIPEFCGITSEQAEGDKWQWCSTRRMRRRTSGAAQNAGGEQAFQR